MKTYNSQVPEPQLGRQKGRGGWERMEGGIESPQRFSKGAPMMYDPYKTHPGFGGPQRGLCGTRIRRVGLNKKSSGAAWLVQNFLGISRRSNQRQMKHRFLKITCSSLTLLNFTSLKIETGKFISLKNTIPQLLH